MSRGSLLTLISPENPSPAASSAETASVSRLGRPWPSTSSETGADMLLDSSMPGLRRGGEALVGWSRGGLPTHQHPHQHHQPIDSPFIQDIKIDEKYFINKKNKTSVFSSTMRREVLNSSPTHQPPSPFTLLSHQNLNQDQQTWINQHIYARKKPFGYIRTIKLSQTTSIQLNKAPTGLDNPSLQDHHIRINKMSLDH